MEENQTQNKLKALEEKIKIAYRDNKWAEVRSLAQEMKGMDPGNHLAQKFIEKAQKIEAEAMAALARKKTESLKPEKSSLISRWMASYAHATLAPKTPEKIEAGNGSNNFTKIFGKPESILDTIVSKTERKSIKKPKKIPAAADTTGVRFLNFASAILQFAAFFILITAGFFYAENLDQENRIIGIFGKESYASRLHEASERLSAKQDEVKKISQEVKRYEEGYNNRYEKIVEGIANNRLNWPEILAKINEVTDTVYERNELSQYIQYNNFSFDAEKGLVRVSGALTDPLGKNLTKLVELEEAFRNYPHDPANPEDPTKPYFYEVQEFNSIRKSLDKRIGRYTSSFQLSFALNPGQSK